MIICLIYFICMIISGSIHVAADGIVSFFSYRGVVFLCLYVTLSSVDGHLAGFHVLTILNSVAVNIGVHVFFF